MRKTIGLVLVLTLAQSFSACHAAAQFSQAQLVSAYQYAMKLYAAHRFDDAKELFKKIAMVSTNPGLNANSLYYFSQCSFRTQDYDACVKSLDMLVQRWPNSSPVAQGYVFKFCYFLINQASQIQDKWDYYRYPEGKDETGATIWKESVPPGFKARRINFRLAFGLYRVLNRIYANAPQTAQCKAKLIKMINTPLTIRWIDEKAPPNRWFHPTDFVSMFSTLEKKNFSKFICDRMFYNWKTEKMYLFLDMYDDIRNLKPRFIAITKNLEDEDAATQTANSPAAPGVSNASYNQDPFYVFTLSKLFQLSGYNPYTDSFTSITDNESTNLTL
jgi:tetratricopeptide (TPR) repeat protein